MAGAARELPLAQAAKIRSLLPALPDSILPIQKPEDFQLDLRRGFRAFSRR